MDWFEVIAENFMADGGRPLEVLEGVRANYPIVLHGVSLSVGSTDPLNRDHLRRLAELARRFAPAWISDHLCWTGVSDSNLHDLMPLPYTEAAIRHIVSRVQQVQDFLGRRILLENVSSYVTYKQSEMSEWAFLEAIAKQADCLLLLDINNIYVSSFNHGFSPQDFIDGIPVDRVQQFHLAGHRNFGGYIIDTHDHPVIDPVWDLYAAAVRRFGRISTMIERDDNIPPIEELMAELDHARAIAETVHAEEIST